MVMKGMWFFGVDFNLMRGKKRRRDFDFKREKKERKKKKGKEVWKYCKALNLTTHLGALCEANMQ